MTIKAVVFDIGNVLIRWAPEAFYDKAIGADRRRAFFAAVPIFEMNLRVDLGADLRQQVQELATAHPDWADEIRLWHDKWIEMASPAIDKSVHLLRALRRRKIPVFALSNFGADTFAQAQENYPFLEEFDATFVSAHLGMAKPDAEIYAHLEAETGLSGAALIFTDDMPENIAAAAARDWQTHLFEGADGWAERLVQAGLLDEEDMQ